MDFFLEECPGTPVEIVINHEARPMIRGQHHQQAAKLLGRPFGTWLPRDQKVARAALDRGVPLAVAGRRSPLSRSIAQLARSVREDLSSSAKSPATTSLRPHKL
jgi:pilus assembly protein CpaE